MRAAAQAHSRGDSCAEIHAAALEAAAGGPDLAWLDIGCGTGKVLRAVRDRLAPSRLVGVDMIDWLDDDLREDVLMIRGPAEEALRGLDPADRVLMIEVIEHVEAPWTVLRAVAGLVAPGGRLVLTTPNVANLRHRLELLARGRLTTFRPDNLPHLTPALPHVVGRVLAEEGLHVRWHHAGRDVIPLTGGQLWPPALRIASRSCAR
jgi:2-polyprenyl-3-methyl-5-hydroxy-6-metoxy-1,4-benzoquinol methylase